MPPARTKIRVAIMVDGANLWHGIVDTHGRKRATTAMGNILAHLPSLIARHEPGCVVVSRDLFFIDEPEYRSVGNEVERAGFVVRYIDAPKLTPQARADGHSRADDHALKRHAMDEVDSFDMLLLVTNDGDYVPLVEILQRAGRQVVVGGYETSGTKMVRLSGELKRTADRILPLQALADKEAPMSSESLPPSDPPNLRLKIEIYRDQTPIYHLEVGTGIIEVGRASKSKNHQPDVDLSEEDVGSILSRRHLRLRFVDRDHVIVQVHAKCSRPNWFNGSLLQPGESVLMSSEDELMLGDENNGFGLLINKS
jgi:hypothetical protein